MNLKYLITFVQSLDGVVFFTLLLFFLLYEVQTLLQCLALSSSYHSSLVDYLAQVINAKNCPTTFYCIFQLVWVPMTTTQNIRVCFLSSKNTLFS